MPRKEAPVFRNARVSISVFAISLMTLAFVSLSSNSSVAAEKKSGAGAVSAAKACKQDTASCRKAADDTIDRESDDAAVNARALWYFTQVCTGRITDYSLPESSAWVKNGGPNPTLGTACHIAGRRLWVDDPKNARRLFDIGCNGKQWHSCNAFAEMLEKGIGGPVLVKDAMAKLRMACSSSNGTVGCILLAKMHKSGKVKSTKDLQSDTALLKEWCDQQVEHACKALGDLP